MNYCIHFFMECPATAMDMEIEIYFDCCQQEEREMFWGFPVAVPASGEIEITKVLKNGVAWLDYPDSLEEEIYNYDWSPTAAILQEPKTIYFTSSDRLARPTSKNKILCQSKKQLAA